MLTPVDDSKGFENVETGGGSGDDRDNVEREDEIGIKVTPIKYASINNLVGINILHTKFTYNIFFKFFITLLYFHLFFLIFIHIFFSNIRIRFLHFSILQIRMYIFMRIFEYSIHH